MGQFLKRAEIPLRFAVILALAYLGYVYLERHSTNRRFTAAGPTPETVDVASARFDSTYGGSALKILAFYAREGVVAEDQSTIICYGVLNAKSVRIDPPVEGVYPALNRCVEVAPEHDTKYTLTAEGNDGRTAASEFTLKVAPDPATFPRVTSFRVAKDSLEDGVHFYTIEFAFENASTVTIDPPVFAPLEDSAPWGKTIVSPRTTTTYTLTVLGKRGRKAQKQLTIEVPKS